ncbi:ProQ/FINO family protein [Xylophilus sp. GW821-FHT01B05]
MTDTVSADAEQAATPLQAHPEPVSQASEAAAPSGAAPRAPRAPKPRGGRRTPQPAAQLGAGRAPRRVHPVLEQLAALYPGLFGEQFQPLKRGVFQDLQEAHPGVFEREALKVALGLHTRSAPYLQVVAAGQKRRNLQGEAVEDLAPEHVHHALSELWRRREQRTPEAEKPALRDHWRSRIARAFEASGLSRADYAELVRTRDEAATALLDEALAEAAGRAAKDEALLRAFDASGATVEAFADMYGLDPRTAGQTLERARKLRGPREG